MPLSNQSQLTTLCQTHIEALQVWVWGNLTQIEHGMTMISSKSILKCHWEFPGITQLLDNNSSLDSPSSTHSSTVYLLLQISILRVVKFSWIAGVWVFAWHEGGATQTSLLLCLDKLQKKQKQGWLNQICVLVSLMCLCICISPTWSRVFLSATWMRWSISSSISLSCIDAWSCALQNNGNLNYIISCILIMQYIGSSTTYCIQDQNQ